MLLKQFFNSLANELQGVFHETNDTAEEWLDRYTEKGEEGKPRRLRTTLIQHGDEIHSLPHVSFAHPSKLLVNRISLDMNVSLDQAGDLAVQLDGRSKDKHTTRVRIDLERVDASEGQHKIITKIDNKFSHEHELVNESR